MRTVSKNNPKTMNAWAFYDWANSVYPLVITSTIFPDYFQQMTQVEGSDRIQFFGIDFINTALYSYALSFSFLLIVAIIPFLSGLADYKGWKKHFMQFFTYLGAASCAGLYFFDGSNVEYGILCMVMASVGFSGSVVFYNGYLPEIADKIHHDRLSARGYAWGYIGSVILLLFNLSMILAPGFYGLPEGSSLPARISFLTVGLWWAGFAQVTFFNLPPPVKSQLQSSSQKLFLRGFNEIKKVFTWVQGMKRLKIYLLAFFLYSVGLQTIMYLAPTFGSKIIGLNTQELILSILTIQIVAIGGAAIFARISEKTGNITTLLIMSIIWGLICVMGYFIQTTFQFYVLAFFVGFVMGGIQSLSRATFSKMIPDETKDTASFFSFYDITEKTAIILGTAAYGLIEQMTGSMRNSILFLLLFFVLAIIQLVKLGKFDKQNAGF